MCVVSWTYWWQLLLFLASEPSEDIHTKIFPKWKLFCKTYCHSLNCVSGHIPKATDNRYPGLKIYKTSTWTVTVAYNSMLQTEESIMLLHVSGGVVSLKHQVVVFPGIYTQIHLILLRVTKLQAVKQSGKLSPEYGSYKINFIH